VADALESSANLVRESIKTMDSFDQTQCRLLVDLVEHEAAHHGQLIRYLYGLKLPVPEGWKERYTLR